MRQFIFSSTSALYGNPAQAPVTEEAQAAPISPYGSSKLDDGDHIARAGTAHGLSYVILRYNVAGADPRCRTGQSTKNATHLIKVRSRGRARASALGRTRFPMNFTQATCRRKSKGDHQAVFSSRQATGSTTQNKHKRRRVFSRCRAEQRYVREHLQLDFLAHDLFAAHSVFPRISCALGRQVPHREQQRHLAWRPRKDNHARGW